MKVLIIIGFRELTMMSGSLLGLYRLPRLGLVGLTHHKRNLIRPHNLL